MVQGSVRELERVYTQNLEFPFRLSPFQDFPLILVAAIAQVYPVSSD